MKMMMNRALVLLLLLLFHLLTLSSLASAKVILIRNNITRSFDDIEANFAPSVKAAGEIGLLYVAEPLDACSDLTNKPEQSSNGTSPFVLIVRGGCSFEDKVRKAQRAGFKAAIIHDNEDRGILIAMAGNSGGIKIHAVFVTKETGDALKEFAGLSDTKVWLLPSFENSAWSIMAVSFISLLAMSAVLATCFFVRRHRIRRRTSRSSRVREFHGMSRRLVKAMPSLIFSSVHEDNTTAFTCAICLEDYSVGDKLRLLPCRHKFHAVCVDSWLTSWRTFCPVCKRDARTANGEPPASESTPLLSSAASSFRSSSALSSFRSSAMLIGPSMGSLPTSISFSPAHASSSYIRQSFRSSSLRRSPPISVSRSSMDLRQQGASPSPSQRSYMASPHSFNYPAMSPLNSRYMSPYRPSPSNASPGMIGSSSNHPLNPLRYSESAGTFSPYASANKAELVMGRGRCRMVMCCEPNEFTEPRPYRPPALKRILFQQKRLAGLREGSQVSLEIQSDKSLKGTDQDQTTLVSGIDIQEKSSSDVVASTSKPQTPSSSLVGMKKTLGSQVSLLRCSACMQIIQSDKSLKGSSDQDQTTLVSQIDIQDQTTLVSQIDIQEKLSSDIVSNTSKTHQGKHLRSSSKIHKPKALLKKKKKKKKKKSSRKAVSTT